MKQHESSRLEVELSNAVKLSGIAGTLKVATQILVALIIYPTIIHIESVATLGAWLLLQIIVGYGGLVHLGMGPVITKEIAKSSNAQLSSANNSSLSEAFACGILFSFILIVVVILFRDQIVEIVQFGVEYTVSYKYLWVVLLGVLIRLFSALYGAVVSGYQRHYLVNISQFLQLLIFTVVFFLMPHTSGVLYDLAVAFTVGYAVELLFIVIVLWHLDRNALVTRPSMIPQNIFFFVKTVKPYFVIDASLLGREPLMKLALFLCCGSTSVGIFELATKVPFCVRQAFVLGLAALMPAFAKLSSEGARENVVALGQTALRYLFFGAIGALFLYWLNSERLLEIWLGSTEPTLLAMTQLLTFWWIIASINVPAWWIGIAMDSERSNTLIASTHLVFTICLVLLTQVVYIDSFVLVALWVLGGVGMQVLLYTLLELKTQVIRAIYLSRQMAFVLLCFLSLVVFTVIGRSVLIEFSLPVDYLMISTVLLYFIPIGVFLFTTMLQRQPRGV
jgi:O-antigen/teichoic acid export membrane protein